MRRKTSLRRNQKRKKNKPDLRRGEHDNRKFNNSCFDSYFRIVFNFVYLGCNWLAYIQLAV